MKKLLLFATVLASVSCSSLTEIANFSSKAKENQSMIGIANEIKKAEIRMSEINENYSYEITAKDRNNMKKLAAAQKVFNNYFKQMNDLTAVKTDAHDGRIDTLGDALDKTGVISEKDTKVGKSFAKAVSNAFLQRSRRRGLVEMFDKGNKPVTNAVDGVSKLTNENILGILKNEQIKISRMKDKYDRLSLRRAELAPLYKSIIRTHYRELQEAKDRIGIHLKNLNKIKADHNDLYENRNKLLKLNAN